MTRFRGELSLALIATALLLSAACHKSPTDPGQSTSGRGRLAGVVSITQHCPASPCTTPPSAYAARKILVYDATHANLLHTVDINNLAFYNITLAPGEYSIDLKGVAGDKSTDVPARVLLRADLVTTLDIHIDPAP